MSSVQCWPFGLIVSHYLMFAKSKASSDQSQSNMPKLSSRQISPLQGLYLAHATISIGGLGGGFSSGPSHHPFAFWYRSKAAGHGQRAAGRKSHWRWVVYTGSGFDPRRWLILLQHSCNINRANDSFDLRSPQSAGLILTSLGSCHRTSQR